MKGLAAIWRGFYEGRRVKSTKKGIAIMLANLKTFSSPNVRLEQYPTDPEIASDILWNMHMLKDTGNVSMDLGCGTGLLGLGTLLIGFTSAIMIDSDKKAIDLAKSNYDMLKSESQGIGDAEFLCNDIDYINTAGLSADVVIQNPPFGTKVRHADRSFVETAIMAAPVCYSLHKTSTKSFIEKLVNEKGGKVTHRWDYLFPIRASYSHHTRRIKRIEASCFRFVRKR